jgi:hypothetical protein
MVCRRAGAVLVASNANGRNGEFNGGIWFYVGDAPQYLKYCPGGPETPENVSIAESTAADPSTTASETSTTAPEPSTTALEPSTTALEPSMTASEPSMRALELSRWKSRNRKGIVDVGDAALPDDDEAPEAGLDAAAAGVNDGTIIIIILFDSSSSSTMTTS